MQVEGVAAVSLLQQRSALTVKAQAEALAKAEAATMQLQEGELQQKIDQASNALYNQYLQEEESSDRLGDPDYEQSANELAKAIGWDRQKIETDADHAVRLFTQAIGGRNLFKMSEMR